MMKYGILTNQIISPDNFLMQFFFFFTSEKAAAEKLAIKKFSAEAKLRSMFMKVPPPFEIDIHEGPFKKEELSDWAKENTNLQDFEVTDGLYGIYLTAWRTGAKGPMIEDCRKALIAGSTLQEIKMVLDTPVFQHIQHEILTELREHQELRLLVPRLDKSAITKIMSQNNLKS